MYSRSSGIQTTRCPFPETGNRPQKRNTKKLEFRCHRVCNITGRSSPINFATQA
jgi:hypothetical protein